MKLCVIAGMIDAKLASKIAPLQNLPGLQRIDLIRRHPWQGERVICHSPPAFFRYFLPLAELWRLFSLVWVCIRHRPDTLIAFGTVPHGIYAWWVGKVLRIPVIQHVMGKNDLRLTFEGQRGRNLTLRAVRAGDRIAVRGSRMRSWLIDQGIPAAKIFAPQNLHDFDHFRPDPDITPDHDLIYVGLLAPYKRIDLMLEAMALARQHIPGLRLLLVGDGPLRAELMSLANNLDITDAVTFVGQVAFDELPTWYRRARVFIMTSQGEGLPMAMIEALGCGLPAIVPADADIGDIAVHGDNAWLVQTWTPEAFRDAIIRLLDDESLLQSMRDSALRLRKTHRNAFSLPHQTALWQEAIASITTHNH